MRGRAWLLCVAWCACVAWWTAVVRATAAGQELRVLQADARAVFYVGIAAPSSAAAVVHAFNRSLAEISHTYLAGDNPLYLRNITLQPLYIELPEDERFSARLLEHSCSILGGRRVAALFVCGGGPAAAAVVSAASRAGVPVLRASPSHLHLSYTIANDMLPLEIRLEITARETLHALRATLLHTHWHSFTLLAVEDIYSTFSLRKDLSSILTTQPLNPKWLSLPTKYSRHALFRRLAEISRLTRGVVVLICDLDYAKLVMDEAKRLNMLDGHFFWLWVDASREFDVFHNIGNGTHFTDENDQHLGRFWDKDQMLENERFDRRRRDDADNNTTKSLNKKNKSSEKIKQNERRLNFSPKNSNFNHRSNMNKSEAHRVNKLLNVNFRKSFDSSRNFSPENIRNYDVNMKGVETSKTERNSIENGKMSFFISNNIRNNSFSQMKNESFNKYVNSINLNRVNSSEDSIDVVNIHNNEINRTLKDNLLISSDISDFLMNPTVQTSVTHNLRQKVEKRGDQTVKKEKRKVNENENIKDNFTEIFNNFPIGLLALHPQPMKVDRTFVRAAVRMTIGALRRVLRACDAWSAQAQFFSDAVASCWDEPSDAATDFSTEFVRETRLAAAAALAGNTDKSERALTASFGLLNLVTNEDGGNMWRQVGRVQGRDVRLHTIVWPGGRLVAHGQSDGARTIFRIVTALAPPFVMEGELDEDGQCLRGLLCHRPQTSDRDNLTLAFNELERDSDQEEADFFFPTPKPMFSRMATHCCYGLAMDLLENIAQELEFDFHLYIVEDGLYGSRKLVKPFHKLSEYRSTVNQYLNQQSYRAQYRSVKGLDNEFPYDDEFDDEPEKWTGIIGDLVSGAAHMSFAALSVSSARAEVIDYSQPYFFSGVSILAAPNQRPDIPLLAFLLPFSPELWIAIFTSLNVTAIAVAIYEWLSPFGLNPWGRQRSKNFSISSALWVMWGLLCGHLVAFKAPKSWPNKFLINVWGGFSVIFVASYTANIAALIAGLFFHNAVDDYQGRSNWLSLRVGTARSSVSEYYVQRNNPQLAQQMRRYALQDIEEGIQRLRNGTLDLLIADTPVLDYYRATDHGCKLQRVGDHALAEDTYAIGMAKGFPLKDSISAVIAKYSSNGYMDILTEKWYGGLSCFKLSPDYGIQPKPLGVAAVAGVFILLGVGMIVGCLILILEHLFYKYTLPVLRHQPKGTIWRSRNIMFFSQKLYRFINCVELVSPHHAARELVNTIRQGHFTSLFQKSVKREHEQRRRRKSRTQLYEMIQAIRRVQQRDHSLGSIKEQETVETTEVSEGLTESKFLSPSPDIPSRSPRPQGRSPRLLRSPRGRRKRCSLAGLNVRRFSTDSVLDSESVSVSNIYERTSMNIGRRLSRDVSCLTNSPPDINTRLKTPSPMIRRAEGSSTRSYQDVSDRSDNYLSTDAPISRASVEILVSEEHEVPPAPPYPRIPPMGARSELSQLSEEELVRLWRSSEREVREALLAALQEKRANLDPKQDPG
ncbi:uncharacterized protein LOC128670645 isoform X2 [Plodia interpunctella]|uniref:uncharacterized protein LOC128670645 isoform X2 n=1 Tax=Plodia interpunctella TaxID=58824 RepID=UPI002367D4D8|nr:uncharacterized protein LOC128670645 isoform X2 [Plodia interpunctella]